MGTVKEGSEGPEQTHRRDFDPVNVVTAKQELAKYRVGFQAKGSTHGEGQVGTRGHGGTQGQRDEQKLLKFSSAKQRSFVFILKFMGTQGTFKREMVNTYYKTAEMKTIENIPVMVSMKSNWNPHTQLVVIKLDKQL